MYTVINFKTKKALKEAVATGKQIETYQPGGMCKMICKCGHDESLHAWGRNRDKQRVRMDCTFSDTGLRFCKCSEFRETKSQEEIEMSKKEKKAKGPKESPAKLATFVDSPFKIYLVMGKKEREATVLSTGLIRFKEVDYKSPCAAATAMAKDMDEKWKLNAWSALKFNKDGKRVSLDTIRGAKSPLAKTEPKAPRKAKSAKPTAKPKPTPRKRKAAKSKTNGAEHATTKQDVTDSDIPQTDEQAATA